MNDFYLGESGEKKSQPMVDFNLQKKKGSKKKVLQIISSKLNSKQQNNPKDIFNASNKINSILSKNLKSIYAENRDEKTKDIPLYKNVNCLLKKNHNTNRYIYNQIMNYNNNSSRTNLGMGNENFKQSGEIFQLNNFDKNNSLFKTSIIKNPSLKNQINIQNDIKNNSQKFGTGISKKIKITKNHENKGKKRVGSSKFINKNNLDGKPAYNYGFEPLFGKDHPKNHRLFSNSLVANKRNLSNKFHFNFNKSTDKYTSKGSLGSKSNNSNSISNSNSIHTGNRISRKLSPVKNININSHSNTKIKANRYNVLNKSSRKKLQMQTLAQINTGITKTYIESQMETVRKELDDFEKDEITEMINKKLKKNKIEKKRKNNLSINKKSNNEISKSEHSEFSKNQTTTLNSLISKEVIEDDKSKIKYRNLFLCKNLYDSLDDEEVLDEEKIYRFHISTNSLTIYILDFIILIASFTELYYLPLYVSLHISQYTIYHNLASSIILGIMDLIYIMDLITGFFRSYLNFEEILVERNLDICINYLTGWFCFDFLEAIPFFSLLNYNMKNLSKKFIEENNTNINMYNYGLNNKYFGLTFLKIFKLFKTFTENKTLIQFNKFLDKNKFFYEWKGLLSILFITLSSLHFSACFFIFIGKNEFHGWIVNNNLQNKSYFDIYVTSLYFQMTTLTTVGYGDISATNGFEIAYGIFILIIGTCVYSWTLTYISNYIKKNNEKYVDFEEKMKVLTEIKIEYPNLGKGLYDRIKRYLNYNKFEHKYNLKFILESLPSSLQNNLIIEIYKPIIKNFQFFKSFENSDFFVKIVTSLKPILSIKEDILIQEGDIIEDIIFIKTGVLALEIIIDLNDPKKSVESHLEMTGMHCFKNISNNKFSFLMNLTTLNSNYRTEIGKQIFNNQYENKKEIKIIDLRKNEHFGDILMILNEKSPLTVKVKSKKAELFFLQKTEATEISNRYSNIWKRIVNRSLHNMKQIKYLIRKKVFLFIESNNIEINPEFKERYINNKKSFLSSYITNINKKKGNSDIFKTIIEEDEESNVMKSQTGLTEKNLEASTKEQTKNIQTEENAEKNNSKLNKSNNKIKNIKLHVDNKNLNINDYEGINGKNFIKNKSFNKDNKTYSENNTMNYILKNFNKNHSFKQDKKSMELNNNINQVNNMISLIDKKVKRSSKKNQINNFNINIYTPKVQIPLNQINIDKKNSKKYNKTESYDSNDSNNSDNFRRINNEISYDNDFIVDIKDNEIMMDNSDENNNIVYTNIKFKENKVKQNSNVSEYYNSNISKLFDSKKVEKIINKRNKKEKTEIKTNDIASIKSVSSDKSKSNIKKKDLNNKDKSTKFDCLNSSHSTSFTIKSSYDNINAISKFNFDKNYILREKTKKFILSQIKNGIAPDVPISKTSKDNINLLNMRSSLKLNNKKIGRQKSSSLSSIKSLPKNENSSRKSFESQIYSKTKTSKPLKKVSTNVKNDSSGSNYLKTFSFMKRRNSIKKRHFKRHQSAAEIDTKSYYNKINRISRRNKSMRKEEKNEKEPKNEKLNYNKLISKNIEINQKNLNNPAEYYARFFKNILCNKNKGNNLFPELEIKKRKTFHRHSII